MPEGPELHLASQLINSICKGRLFAGKVRRNPIHKCADVEWDEPSYEISAVSRGKELKVFLQSHQDKDGKSKGKDSKKDVKNGGTQAGNRLQLLFNFGMSGKFEFTSAAELPKHAHLSFYTKSDPDTMMALSFVDYRRFGKWQVGADWSADRGPCVLFEYPLFRSHVLSSLHESAFNRPLCEVLLNQKYFNGIGNYLRAEIIYRAGVRPFEQARSVLAALPDVPAKVKTEFEDEVKTAVKVKVKSESPDILELCSVIPQEVVGLGTTLYLPEDDHDDISKFSRWLQCYYKPGMKNIADHNRRTMWYHGDPGPLVPKEGRSSGKKKSGVYSKKLTKNQKSQTDSSNDADATDMEEDKKVGKQESPEKTSKRTRATRAAVKKEENKTAKTKTKAGAAKSAEKQKEIKAKTPKTRKRPAAQASIENGGEKVQSKQTSRTKTVKSKPSMPNEELPDEPKTKRARSGKSAKSVEEKASDLTTSDSLLKTSGKKRSRATRSSLVADGETSVKKSRRSRK